MDNLNQQTSPSKPLPSSLLNQAALSSPHPSNPSKTFIILLLVMLIVIVGVGGYTLGIKHGKTIVQNQQTTTSPTTTQPSPTQNPTANWKTYTNTRYNYQIKYPPDWIIEVDGIVVWQDDVPKPELGKQIIFFKSTVHEPYIWILPYPNPKQLSLKDHLIEEILKPIDFPDLSGDSKEQVEKMKQIIIPGTEEALEGSDPSGAPIVYLRKGSMTIMLFLSYGENPDAATKTFAKQTFDQILSTFKFLAENISWEEAVELIRSCQVKMASQTHSRNVDLTLKDGTIRITVEPKLDMVIEEAESASTKCGFDISVETE